MNNLWIIAYVILGIITIIFILLYFYSVATLVSPEQCGAATGTYGVRPGKSGITLLGCGTNRDQPCIFSDLTLSQAMSVCDQNFQLCSAFSYNQRTGTITFIDVNQPITNAPTLDLYQRRANIIISN